MSEDKKPIFQFLHSTYWKNNNKNNPEDAIIATLKNVDTNELKLEIIKNPRRTIGITKKGYQSTHSSKKVYEKVDNLDLYTIPNNNLQNELQRLLIGHNYGYKSLKQLINNPYVYAADIDINVLAKQHFLNLSDRVVSSFRVGGLDIENSVLGGKEILIITYVSPEFKIYTAVLDAFMKSTNIEAINNLFKVKFEEFKSKLNKDAKKALELYIPELIVSSHITEIDVIKYIFDVIHKDKPEFISIWNMGWDIPYILDRIATFNRSATNIMCHPDVPNNIRVCNYKNDTNTKLAHFTHKWDVFELSGYTQFYDSMCLFSRLRKHEGMEDSYALKNISTKYLGASKLEFDDANHTIMQTSRQLEYIVYNMFDGILIVLLDKVVNDISSMMGLIKDTSIDSFAQQTVQLKNWFYNYCKPKGLLPASWQGKILHETDELISNVGGNVLSPGLAWRTGVVKIKELINTVKDAVSKLIILASDIDVALA